MLCPASFLDFVIGKVDPVFVNQIESRQEVLLKVYPLSFVVLESVRNPEGVRQSPTVKTSLRLVRRFGTEQGANCSEPVDWRLAFLKAGQIFPGAHRDTNVCQRDLALRIGTDRAPTTSEIEFDMNNVAAFGLELSPGNRTSAHKILVGTISHLISFRGVFLEQFVAAEKLPVRVPGNQIEVAWLWQRFSERSSTQAQCGDKDRNAGLHFVDAVRRRGWTNLVGLYATPGSKPSAFLKER